MGAVRPDRGHLVSLTMALGLVLAGCASAAPSAGATVSTGVPSDSPLTPPVTTSSPAPTCPAAPVLRRWSTQRLAAQVVVAPAQMTAVGALGPAVQEGLGGVILFGPSAPSDLASRLQRLDSNVTNSVHPLVMTDEEGGYVQRLEALVGPVPSAREMAQTMTTQQIQAEGLRVGQAMLRNGVDMDLAPVLDLDDRPGPTATNPDGTRSFSINPTIAGRDGVAFARGLQQAGVLPVVKHFPGLGYATGNTDVGPASTLPWSQLQQAGLLPFRRAFTAGMPVVMVANASVPGLTAAPATLSPKVMTTVLRTDLGFTGVIITDSLSAGAISATGHNVAGAAIASLNAGADLVLFGSGTSQGSRPSLHLISALAHAVSRGVLTRQTLINADRHIVQLKRLTSCP